MRLAGQVAVVTGGGRGIGAAIAQALAAEGMAVAVTARSADQLADVVSAIESRGGTAIAVVADVAEPAQVQAALAEVVDRLGPIDLLVNNAGRGPERFCVLWEEADMTDWWQVLAVNLLGPAVACHTVIPAMLARGAGRIVNIGSLAGSEPEPILGSYVISKAALMRLTDCLAVSLADTGVRVFEINPGLVRTALVEAHPHIFGHLPDEAYAPTSLAADAVVRIAAGDLDPLNGRILDVSEDDLDDLLARADQIVAADARTLRLRTFGPGDPLEPSGS